MCKELGFEPSSKLSTTNGWWSELWWKHVPDGCNVETLSAELCSCRKDKYVVAFCWTKICPTRNADDWWLLQQSLLNFQNRWAMYLWQHPAVSHRARFACLSPVVYSQWARCYMTRHSHQLCYWWRPWWWERVKVCLYCSENVELTVFK